MARRATAAAEAAHRGHLQVTQLQHFWYEGQALPSFSTFHIETTAERLILLVLQAYSEAVLSMDHVKTACEEALMPCHMRHAKRSGLWLEVLDGLFCMAPCLLV